MLKFTTVGVCGYLNGPCVLVVTAGAAHRHRPATPRPLWNTAKAPKPQNSLHGPLLGSGLRFWAFCCRFGPERAGATGRSPEASCFLPLHSRNVCPPRGSSPPYSSALGLKPTALDLRPDQVHPGAAPGALRSLASGGGKKSANAPPLSTAALGETPLREPQ
jgi:hypothetical protein